MVYCNNTNSSAVASSPAAANSNRNSYQSPANNNNNTSTTTPTSVQRSTTSNNRSNNTGSNLRPAATNLLSPNNATTTNNTQSSQGNSSIPSDRNRTNHDGPIIDDDFFNNDELDRILPTNCPITRGHELRFLKPLIQQSYGDLATKLLYEINLLIALPTDHNAYSVNRRNLLVKAFLSLPLLVLISIQASAPNNIIKYNNNHQPSYSSTFVQYHPPTELTLFGSETFVQGDTPATRARIGAYTNHLLRRILQDENPAAVMLSYIDIATTPPPDMLAGGNLIDPSHFDGGLDVHQPTLAFPKGLEKRVCEKVKANMLSDAVNLMERHNAGDSVISRVDNREDILQKIKDKHPIRSDLDNLPVASLAELRAAEDFIITPEDVLSVCPLKKLSSTAFSG